VKTRLVFAALLLALTATAQADSAAPSSTQGAGAAQLPFIPSFASVINKTIGCTASLTCPNGTGISCSSGVPSTCTVGTNYVDCNGARTNCPTTCYIQRQCCNGEFVSCEGSTPTSCRFAIGGVRCDNDVYPCPFCPQNP